MRWKRMGFVGEPVPVNGVVYYEGFDGKVPIKLQYCVPNQTNPEWQDVEMVEEWNSDDYE